MRIFTRFLTPLLLLALMLTTPAYTSAQTEYALPYQDKTVELPANISTVKWLDFPADERINGGHYVWLQFTATPVQSVQDEIAASPIELIDFIGNKTYLAFVPLSTEMTYLEDLGVRSVSRIMGEYKMSIPLRDGDIGDWAKSNNKIAVTLDHYEGISTQYVLDQLEDLGISLKQEYKGATLVELSIPDDCLEQLTALPFVKWVEVIAAPPVKDDIDGRNLHRAGNLDTQIPGDRNYDGSGIGVMVRDDGIVGPHIDFQGRIDNTSTGDATGTHGDGVAGIMAGAGNLNPNNRGMAAGADMYVVDYGASHLDGPTTSRIVDGSVQITNSSYSNGCNDGYTSVTRTVDNQAMIYPNLLHVFSAGNSNNNDCGYGAGSQWGNITGGHKQGKNVIATANVFADAELVASSSRGPAHDGRIKPDIAANGQDQISTSPDNGYSAFGGTSGAAPGIAGISAQLYQAYRELNDNEYPKSELIKATLLNTANDYGNEGPDFKFGWGIVNAYRAVQLLEDNRYFFDTIAQGEKNSHVISIPENTAQVRFMVYWKDPAAFNGASKALINDIDLIVLPEVIDTLPADTLYPWLLNEVANAATLDEPAGNGVDRLNNVEQVLINEPAAGDYTLDITGFDIPMGPQEYVIVYEVITDHLTVTAPNSRVNLVAGSTEYIHWDAVNTTESFVIEYSRDNGASWLTAGFANADQRLFNWSIPFQRTGEALIRVTSGEYQDVSDTTFSYSNRVNGLDVDAACPTEMTFSWNPLGGADSYDLYLLGEKYMEVRGTTSETSITIADLPLGSEIWYAVVAHSSTEGWSSLRTNAERFQSEDLLNCVLANDLLVADVLSGPGNFSSACNATPDNLVSVAITNNGMTDQTGFLVSYQLDGEPAVTETFTDVLAVGETAIYTFAEQLFITNTGTYNLTLDIDFELDEFEANDVETVTFFIAAEASETPFAEDFETTGFPSNSFLLDNPDGSFGWEENLFIPSSGGGNSTVGFIDNFAYNGNGAEDIIQTQIFELGVNAMVSFDLAKAQFSPNFSDAFRVDISTDCGDTFSEIYFKDGLELSTVGDYQTAIFSPASASDWRTETIDISDFDTQNVMFRFVNVNGYGNQTYIDNINVMSDTVSSTTNFELRGVAVFPNPASAQLNITLPVDAGQQLSLRLMNSVGQTVSFVQREVAGVQTSLNVADLPSGIYYLQIQAGNRSTVKKVMVE